MTTKEKTGCAIGIVTLFVRLPLAWASTYLLYKHVGAPDVLWLLFFIAIPITLVIEIVSEIIKNAIKES